MLQNGKDKNNASDEQEMKLAIFYKNNFKKPKKSQQSITILKADHWDSGIHYTNTGVHTGHTHTNIYAGDKFHFENSNEGQRA